MRIPLKVYKNNSTGQVTISIPKVIAQAMQLGERSEVWIEEGGKYENTKKKYNLLVDVSEAQEKEPDV